MPASPLRIHLLGEFRLLYGDEPVPGFGKPRLQALLAYMILHAGAPLSRQHLAFTFWSDTPESLARNNLRQLLYQLRQLLPEPDRFLIIDAQTVTWRRDPDQAVDVELFEQALAEAEAAARRAEPQVVRRRLADALAHYTGDLLPACYDEWITPERERLVQQRFRALRTLVSVLEVQGDYPAALQSAQVLLRLDPLDEQTYVTLMRLHSLNHDLAGVRRAYRSAVDRLQQELGLEPPAELRRAFEQAQRQAAAPVPAPVEEGSSSVALVGRRAEWRLLQKVWQQASGGKSQLLLVTGEAGIGKSRLAAELFHWARRQGAACAQTRCYAAEGRLSLAPITEWLRSDALRAFWPALDGLWLTEVARLVPELLAERTDLARPESIGEYGQRQRFFEALARAILAAPQAILLWIDDLQWCDPETLEWLHFLLRWRPQSPLLLVGTARSEEAPPDHPLSGLARQLRIEGRLVSLELPALDAAETARLAAQIEGRELDVAASVRLFHETEGNPLFVVETVRAALGGASSERAPGLPRTGQPSPLPPRVYALIAGRLAQLSPASRKVAELGAAIGRSFSLDVLRRASDETDERLIGALDELWQKRIVREVNPNRFDFTHDKLREVAYAEIGQPQRRRLHRCIAEALEAVHAPALEAVSTEIAAQYEQAGLYARALPYYQLAGAAAARVFANDSAIDLFRRAQVLLAKLPPSPTRDEQELSVELALAPLYRITKGWVSPEVERALNRALVLSVRVEDVGQRAATLYGLQALYVVAGKLREVVKTFDEVHVLFMQRQGHPPPPPAGLMYAGAQLHMGQARAARERFASIVAVRDEQHVRDLQASQGWNYLVHGYAWNAHALWYLGYPQAALEAAAAAVQFASEYEQPFNRALSLTYLAMLQELQADAATFRAKANEALVLAEECQAPYYHAWAEILVHFAQALDEPHGASLAGLQAAVGAFRATGARLRLPYYLSLLARAQRQAGQLDEALITLAQALEEGVTNDERWWDADLHRLRGEILWKQGAPAEEVETAFRQALALAGECASRSLELRAATALARLWRDLGRPTEARQVLLPIYSWFTEGIDTPDLQAAQALLQQL